MGRLRADLGEAGFRIEDEDWLMHNPLLVSMGCF
jgi:hypothetical protein